MRISIAIATYNRADELERTLSSLALVDQSGLDDFEVLVIDNNSNDSTAEVARRMSDLFGGRLRRVLESKQGLSHARNRAISEARYEIVAFLDDDVDVDVCWMRQLAAAFENGGPAAVGGRATLLYPRAKPQWLGEREEGLLTKVELGTQRRRAHSDELYGVNLSLLKRWVVRVGGFRTDLGRVGSCLLGSEEADLLERIEAAGGLLIYEPNAKVGHRVAPARLHRRWFWSRLYWGERGEARRLSEADVSYYELTRRGWHVVQAWCTLARAMLVHNPFRAICFHHSVILAARVGSCVGMAHRLATRPGVEVRSGTRDVAARQVEPI